MIPVQRSPLPAKVSAALGRYTAKVSGAADQQKEARSQWRTASNTRRELRAQLVTMCVRPTFCMYCHESRGTDVDHFVPIARDPGLTFAWANHLLACGYCNQQAKQEKFPLDAGGHGLLLDPSVDDSAQHMTLSSSGELIDLTPRGAATIEVLGLNRRAELVRARYVSWRGIIRVFGQAARQGSELTADDLEDLRFLPVVDALHHFAHDVAIGRLGRKAVDPGIIGFATGALATLRQVFPLCAL